MMKAGIPSEGGPIGVMLAEHEMGRKYVRNMGKDIEIYKEKGVVAFRGKCTKIYRTA